MFRKVAETQVTMKLLIVLAVAFVGCSTADTGNSVWNFTSTDLLKKTLFQDYDHLARPDEHVTNLTFGLSILKLNVDEINSVMNVNSWIRMNWTDSKLKWNPADYGNLTVLHVGANEVWKPDITVYNSAGGNDIEYYGNTNCLIYSNGVVLWVPPSKYDTFCELNLKYWPYDTQTCRIVFGSWTYSGYKISLSFFENALDISEYIAPKSGEWLIVKTAEEVHSKYYACCDEPYFDATYNITIQRRAPITKGIVVTPAIIIVIMTLACFWLPPQSGEKILINGVSVITICLMMMYISQLIPVQAIGNPLILCFYTASLYLIGISTLVSIIVINLSRNIKTKAIPQWIKNNILEGALGTIFGPKQPKVSTGTNGDLKEANADHQITSSKNETSVIQSEWILFAIIIDRFVFVVYLIAFFVLGFKLFW